MSALTQRHNPIVAFKCRILGRLRAVPSDAPDNRRQFDRTKDTLARFQKEIANRNKLDR